MKKTLGSLILLALASTATLADVRWSLVDESCLSTNPSTLVIACGDYGTFHFGDGQPPAGCNAVASGREVPPTYPKPVRSLQPFPIQPKKLGQFQEAEAHPAAPLGAADDPEPDTPEVSDPTHRIVAIDYDNDHGYSIVEMIKSIVGEFTEVLLAPLDDPELAPLGEEVGDFHVLAKLCEIAEGIDNHDEPLPLSVNMSFGRTTVSRDPDSPATCDPANGNCHVARVIEHLSHQGIFFVAAAGNHQQMLFPAGLIDVISSGMLNSNQFLAKQGISPAWESPPETRAVVPGNGLCIGDWVAPAGSSYSAALLNGWLAYVQLSNPSLDPMPSMFWNPQWNARLECYVLADGRQQLKVCNDAIDGYFDGIQGANSLGCWLGGRSAAAQAPEPEDPEQQPETPSLATFSATTTPTPVSDPCVPCEASDNGTGGGSGNNMTLNMSQSAPMPEGQILDSVMIRVDQDFFPLQLSPAQLLAVQDATLGDITLPGWGFLLKIGEQPSFWYQSKNDSEVDCAVTPWECYWSSTPIVVPPLP